MSAANDARATPVSKRFTAHRRSIAAAFALGASTVLGFAPFYLFFVPVLTLALLLLMWQGHGARKAFTTGFAYGLGFFLCGVSWVYVSLHDFGAMPAPLAALATLLFCAFLALFPAVAGYLHARLTLSPGMRLALLFPALWTLLEWTRGWLFTGFPWLALGYSQIPMSPLAGYAPLVGIFGVTLSVALTAGIAAHLWQRYRTERRISPVLLFTVMALWVAGCGLKTVEWTRPVGEPVGVSLLQGNVPQDLKFREDRLQKTLEDYQALAHSSASQLIVFPETALPLFLEHVPAGYLEGLADHARRNGGDMLIGVPERLPDGRYYNSVVSVGSAPAQTYRKFHLVPFGEFIPLRPLLGGIVGALAIPLQDFSRGPTHPRPLAVAGQRVAVNVCYEDAFGEEIIRQLPQATVLVNVSNVAWFGRSIAPQQHLQISQARALETGRYMLRATNTGVTAVIDVRGEVVKRAP
ncbi:MAG TPA: apolipoprotein N-acyltransferase, partial [Burkholderiales bacterium]|nr:apolipoprotein N-acyltransferase [Burkholderiales bacterium]